MHNVKPGLLDEPVWLTIARRELGVREVPGAKHNPRVLQYHAATKLHASADEVAWCASFVAYCYQEAGIRHLRSARAADWAKFGRETYLEPGALVVLHPPRRGPNPDNANSGHVGFLTGVEGDQLLLISGNSANCVRVSPYPATRLMACRWPDAQ